MITGNIYKITNSVDKNVYVGCTQKPIDVRFKKPVYVYFTNSVKA